MLKELLMSDRNARRVFGRREIEIIIKQLEGKALTQSERNRLSRDIKPKLEFIRNAGRFEDEFKLGKNQENREIIKRATDVILQDELGSEVRAILLFGSFADGTFTPRSDIDICVVFRKDISLKEATQFRIRASGQLPEKADIQVFNTLPQKVKRGIARNHKVIYKAAGYDNREFTMKHLKGDYHLKQIQNILASSKPELRKKYKVGGLGIFGSYARGEQKKTSDLDILVRFKPGATLFDFVGLGNYLEERLKMKVDMVSENGIRPELKGNIIKEVLKV